MTPGDSPPPQDDTTPGTDHRPALAQNDSQGGVSRPLLAATLLVSFVLTLWPIASTPWFFSNDGPEHLYSAWIWLRSADLSPLEQAHLQTHWPATAVFATAALAPLLGVLPWATAWKGFLLGSAALMHAGLSGLLLRAAPRQWPLLLAVPPLTTGWLFLMGFHNFYGALAAGLLLVAAVVRVRFWTWPQTAGILVALLLIAACHTLGAALTGLLLAFSVLTQTGFSAPERTQSLLRLAAVGVPTLAFVLSVGADYETSATLARDEGVRWIVREHLIEFFQSAVPGPAWITLPLPLLALLGWMVRTPVVLRSWQVAQHTDGPQEHADGFSAPALRMLWVSALVCALVWALFPFSTSSWQMISPRFAPVAILAGLILLPTPTKAAQYGLLAVCLCVSVAWASWLHDFQRRMNDGCADVTAALHAATDQDMYQGWLSFRACTQTSGFMESTEIPWAHFTKHMPAAFATAGQSLYQGFHGKPSIHTHTLFTDHDLMPGRRPDANYLGLQVMGMRAAGYSVQQMQPALLDIHERAATWDHTWVFGASDIFDSAFPAYDFQTLQQTGDLTLVKFVGCSLTIDLPPSAAALRLEHGWIPRPPQAPFQRVSVPAGTTSIPLARTTCGPIWVRLYDDATGNPVPCTGANAPELQQTLPSNSERRVNCR